MENLRISRIDKTNFESHHDDLLTICRAAELDSHPMAKNYVLDNWENNPASLLYLITKSKRYDHGCFFMLYYHDEPIAVSGCYQSDWSSMVMILGSRTYTVPSQRTDWWHSKYLLPQQQDYAESHGYRVTLMSFENDSDILFQFIDRITKKKTVVLGHRNPDFYHKFQSVPGKFMIKNTAQKIVVSLIGDTSLEDFYRYYKPPEFKDVSIMG
jgi:hypothetical protein